MQRWAPLILIAFALVFLVLMITDNSYSKLVFMNESIKRQTDRNAELRREVEELRSKVYNLKNNPRELEKAARNKLGMARPDEEIFIFEKKIKD